MYLSGQSNRLDVPVIVQKNTKPLAWRCGDSPRGDHGNMRGEVCAAGLVNLEIEFRIELLPVLSARDDRSSREVLEAYARYLGGDKRAGHERPAPLLEAAEDADDEPRAGYDTGSRDGKARRL
jgi:hypothetical protein